MTKLVLLLLNAALLAALWACGGASEAVLVPTSSFALTSAAALSGNLPADYTCDGAGSTPALA